MQKGDRFRYIGVNDIAVAERIGKTGTITQVRHSYNPSMKYSVKWDDECVWPTILHAKNIEKEKVVESSIDAKALAKAYFDGNTAEVERLLKPFRVETLPAGAVLAAPDLKLVWVVTKKNVLVIDTETGSSNTSGHTVQTFSEWAHENGTIVRVK